MTTKKRPWFPTFFTTLIVQTPAYANGAGLIGGTDKPTAIYFSTPRLTIIDAVGLLALLLLLALSIIIAKKRFKRSRLSNNQQNINP